MALKAVFAEDLNNTSTIIYIPVYDIRPNPYQPRKLFEKAGLEELANSIREYGVMQPISVRRNGDKYELVAGERRLRASKLAGEERIPAIVIDISERDSAFLALLENLQRENLNFLEEAEGYQNLIEDYGLTQEEVAKKLGKSQSNIANKVRVLKLPEEVKKTLAENNLTERHARALLKIPDMEAQKKALDKIITEHLNVRNTDDYVDSLLLKMSAGTQTAKKSKNAMPQKLYIKDTRIYTNTIKKAINMIIQSGGQVSYTIADSEENVEILIDIKKRHG